MGAATEGNLPPVMPEGNLVEILGREVRRGLPEELMVESSPSCQRRPPLKTNKGMSDEAADAGAHTYLLTPIGMQIGSDFILNSPNLLRNCSIANSGANSSLKSPKCEIRANLLCEFAGYRCHALAPPPLPNRHFCKFCFPDFSKPLKN